jgi:hypothetical protein
LKNTEAFLFKKKNRLKGTTNPELSKDLYIKILDNTYILSYFDMFDGLMGAKRDQLYIYKRWSCP